MPHFRTRVLAAVAIVLLSMFTTGGCIRNLGREPAWGKPTTLLFDLDDDVAIPERPVVIFLIDGLHKATFEEMLAAGELPHIKHYLVDRGVSVDKAVGCLPTVTFADITSYATGRYPGHHGVLGNKWFDPLHLECQDYVTIGTMSLVNDDIRVPTVYELLDREKSVVMVTQINRGCTRFYENWMRIGPAWFFKMFRNVSMSTTARLQNTVWEANEDQRWPDLITLYYPATDEAAHLYGHGSDTYRELIRVFDAEVGDACKAFEKEGFLDRVLLVLVTDHGMADASRHCDVVGALRDDRLKVWTKPLNEQWGHYQQRFAKLKDYHAVVVVDSERFAKIHFRIPGRSWAYRPTLEEIAKLSADLYHAHAQTTRPPGQGRIHEVTFKDTVGTLLMLPGVEFFAHSDRGLPKTRVRLQTRKGHAVITRRTDGRGKVYSYRVAAGADPLGYGDHPAAAQLSGGEFHTADAWLAATIDTEYPDVVSQLPEMFDSPRAGDLCLFARPGWDFGRTNKSGHGGLSRDETVVPLVFAGGGLPQGGRIRYARTLALVPTVVHFIRDEIDPALFRHFDERSLLDILRAAGQNAPSATP